MNFPFVKRKEKNKFESSCVERMASSIDENQRVQPLRTPDVDEAHEEVFLSEEDLEEELNPNEDLEFRSSTGRTREEWKSDSKNRRRRKRAKRRKIAKRNMYLCVAIGMIVLSIFVTFIVLIYKS